MQSALLSAEAAINNILILRLGMAADTREPERAPLDPATSSTIPTSQSRTYETFNAPIAPENVNALPGGGLNTAGGRPKDAGLLKAIKSVRLQELKEVHKKPCVRDALLTGIGAGFGVGGIRAIMGGKCCRSSNSTFSDPSSANIQGLQLGCGYVLLWVLRCV